ncbi:hypothetical protein [Nonomuraea sp. SBT364]|uniref:hypothetical protein n=1 Tax=Nonomuraea sp. SBT364 TaxID=1580530 RepID=UPI0012E2B4B4|nr:hypothetical protein [Nonomuraea sp. SBT364]
MGTERIPYLLGYHEIARLFQVARDAPLQWRKRSLLREPDWVISGSPYWLLPTVLALSKPGYREVDLQWLDGYKAGIPGGYVTQDTDRMPSLIGIQEVSWIFGKNSSAIGQWRNRGTLPDPDLILSGSPLWSLETILADAERRDRSISQAAVARIRAGERAQSSRRRLASSQSGQPGAVPAARTFTSEERPAATSFLESVLAAGHAVEIRPHPSKSLRPKQDGQSAPDSLSGMNP